MEKAEDHRFFASVPKVEVIAHRGGAGESPGETIYAFAHAIKIGADILEMDIRYTSDGEPVLMHNRNVLHTTGVDKNVEEFTADEIQSLTADFWWKKAGKVFPPDEVKVPKLKEVLDRFRDRRMNIEIKPFNVPIALIQKFGRLLLDFGMTDKVLVASACQRNLSVFRREFPQVATSASLRELFTFRVFKSLGYRPNCVALQLSSKAGPLHFITREYVDKAHSLNLKVHGWTVNQPEEMGRLIEAGVDGIITDYPTTLLTILNRL